MKSLRAALQCLHTPDGVVGSPCVAAADAAGHSVVVVDAVVVVPADVAAAGAGAHDVQAGTFAAEAVTPGGAFALGAGEDTCLAWWCDGVGHCGHLVARLPLPRMHRPAVILLPVRCLVLRFARVWRWRWGSVAWVAG